MSDSNHVFLLFFFWFKLWMMMGQIHQEQNHIDSAREAYKQGVRNGIRQTLQFLHCNELIWEDRKLNPTFPTLSFYSRHKIWTSFSDSVFWRMFSLLFTDKKMSPFHSHLVVTRKTWRERRYERNRNSNFFYPFRQTPLAWYQKKNFHVATKLSVILH